MSLGIGTIYNDNGVERDIWVEFAISSFYPGFAGDRYSPPEDSSYEFEIVSVNFDPNDEIMSEEIRSMVEDWFYNSKEAYSRAVEVASEYQNFDGEREYECEDMG